jgi:hypothetical protein
MRSLWRGSLLPFGAAGAVNRGCGVSEGIWWQDLGLLRSPAGASSLATVGGVLRVFRTP